MLILFLFLFPMSMGFLSPPRDFRKQLEDRMEKIAPGTYNTLLQLPQGFGKTLELLRFLAYLQEVHDNIDDYTMEQDGPVKEPIWPRTDKIQISKLRLF